MNTFKSIKVKKLQCAARGSLSFLISCVPRRICVHLCSSVVAFLLCVSVANSQSPLFEVQLTAPLDVTAAGGQFFTRPADDFTPAGLRLDAPDEFIRFPQLGRIAPASGTVEITYQPLYNSADSSKSVIFSTATWNSPCGYIAMHKMWDGTFMVVSGCKLENITVPVSYARGQTLILRVAWDWNAAPGQRNLRIWLNGAELAMVKASTGAPAFPVPQENPGEWLWLGSRESNFTKTWISNVITTFRSWPGIVPPPPAGCPSAEASSGGGQ